VLLLSEILLIYVTITVYRYFTEERKKKELKSTFANYVSPAIVDEILKSPENLNLGGRKQRMSVFFSDVRGFTTISEKLSPTDLSKLLSDYLTPMTELVFKNKGTLDKYMGDAIMAFFGAPVFRPDHAADACRCALESMKKLKEVQAEFASKNLPLIDIGIGINTGDMSVGNMGSNRIKSYTVMGDSVNLGSRLEGINKEYGTHIIISEFTHKDIQGKFVCRPVDSVRVKGKLEPVKIFELLSEEALPAGLQEWLKEYELGYELYLKKQFSEALSHFDKASQLGTDDEVSKLYIERCQEYMATPPPPDWDGVFVMKTK
jgi:adenylate cyclase